MTIINTLAIAQVLVLSLYSLVSTTHDTQEGGAHEKLLFALAGGGRERDRLENVLKRVGNDAAQLGRVGAALERRETDKER